jgi:hypothetical protein
MAKTVKNPISAGTILDNGYEVINIRKASSHPDDAHLFYVLCFTETNYGIKYATWLYNADVASTNFGHYFEGYEKFGMNPNEAFEDAKHDFYIR